MGLRFRRKEFNVTVLDLYMHVQYTCFKTAYVSIYEFGLRSFSVYCLASVRIG